MIAYVMLYTVIAGIPILLAALALATVLRRYGRPERGVWLGALVLAFALPTLSLLDPVRSAPAVESPPAASVIGLPEVVAVPAPPSSLDLGRALVAAWVTASLLMALRWMIATLRLLRASRSWRPGTVNGVPVLMTEDLGPAVSGVLRPRVLAPLWLTSLPSRERELILMHEQEHVRAHDPVLVAVARAACVLAPWNPVVWALSANLVRAVELDCDRRVLRRSADVAAYGRTLLTVSLRRPGRLVAAAAFAESDAPLRTRILSMTTPPRTLSILAIMASTVLGVVLLVGALQIPVPAISIDVSIGPTPDQTPSVTVFDAPPTPPAPPERPVVVLGELPQPSIGTPPGLVVAKVPDGRFITWRDPNGGIELRRQDGAAAPEVVEVRLVNAAERVDVQQVPEPAFTPMTVPPRLVNGEAISQVLMREYPAALRDAGIGGAPVLWIYVGTDGTVQSTRINQSSGFAALDEAAQIVARAMRFTPAENRGEVVPVWMQIPIRFRVAR
jgi:TonB family protein